MKVRRHHRLQADEAARPRVCEDAAYSLLEEARLNCEELLARADTSDQHSGLQRLHRELGLAGFVVSSNISSVRRRRLLEAARERCEAQIAHAPTSLHELDAVAKRAERAVEDAFVSPGLTDHVHLAHIHGLRALELLTAMLRPCSSKMSRDRAAPGS